MSVAFDWVLLSKQLARLYPHLSVDDWWGMDDPYERSWSCVLVQNTTWHNATLALKSLLENGLTSVSGILAVDEERLRHVIRSAGFYRAKAAALKRLAAWWERNGGLEGASKLETEHIRTDVLQLRGIGAETADTLLLYVLNRRTFIGDAYTRRFISRISGEKEKSYNEIREAVLATELDTRRLQYLHAYIVEFGKDVCRKRNPDCLSCLLQDTCNYGRGKQCQLKAFPS